MSKIGIMGGTFNPIHNGHLALAQYAMDTLSLDEVWFIPTGVSYMKAGQVIVSAEDRFRMTCLAVEGNSRMKVLDIEIKRSGYTYSYETLEQLRAEYPENQFYFIFGTDCLFDIEKWRYPERIFAAANIVVALRNGADQDEISAKCRDLKQKFNASITLLPFLHLEISSTLIRQMTKEGKSARYLVPTKVFDYIEEKKFYREDS